MATILIEPENSNEFKFIKELLKRTKIKSRELSKQEGEDYFLLQLMKKEKTGKNVSESTIMKKLKAKSK